MTINLPPRFFHTYWAVWVLMLLFGEWLAWKDADTGDYFSDYMWAFMFDGARPRPVLYWVGAGILVWILLHGLTRGRF